MMDVHCFLFVQFYFIDILERVAGMEILERVNLMACI